MHIIFYILLLFLCIFIGEQYVLCFYVCNTKHVICALDTLNAKFDPYASFAYLTSNKISINLLHNNTIHKGNIGLVDGFLSWIRFEPDSIVEF